MKYLWKMFIREFKRLWVQFISVFIMTAISLMIFSGMSSVWVNIQNTYETYSKESNLADAFLYGQSLSAEDVEAFGRQPEVKEAGRMMDVTLDARVEDRDCDIRLATLCEANQEVLKPYVLSGEKLDYEKDGIWLDESFAKENHLKEGETVSLSFMGKEAELEIVGLVMNPEHAYFVTSATENVPDFKQHGYGYLTETYAKELFGTISYNSIRLSLKEELSRGEVYEMTEGILGERLFSVDTRDSRISIARVEDDKTQTIKMAFLFSVIFILLSLLTIYTTMNRLINNQIVQIGTLKALGYSRFKIYFLYGLYGFFTSFLGGLAGILIGVSAISRLVMNVKETIMEMPEWNHSVTTIALVVWLVMIVVCTSSAVLASRSIVKDVPALTIRGISKTKEMKKKEIRPGRLSYEWLWTIRSLKLHPVRYIMGIVAVLGSLTLMVAGLGIQDSLDTSYEDIYHEQYSYDYAASIKNGAYEPVKEYFSGENVQYASNLSTEISFGENVFDGTICVAADGEFLHLYEDGTGKEISLEKEGAAIPRKLAGILGVQKGDTVTYHINNTSEEYEVVITCVIDAKMPQGLYLSEDAYPGDFQPNTVYMEETAYEKAKDCEHLTGLLSVEKQESNMFVMIDSVRVIAYILILASFLLAAVILYNLGSLNFIERYREYAAMKVLGFYQRETRNMVLIESVLTLLLGIVTGIPASLAFLNMYVNVVCLNSVEWTPTITPLHYGIALAAVIVFSVGISLLVSQKIRKVDMVAAMKSVE